MNSRKIIAARVTVRCHSAKTDLFPARLKCCFLRLFLLVLFLDLSNEQGSQSKLDSDDFVVNQFVNSIWYICCSCSLHVLQSGSHILVYSVHVFHVQEHFSTCACTCTKTGSKSNFVPMLLPPPSQISYVMFDMSFVEFIRIFELYSTYIKITWWSFRPTFCTILQN